MIEFNNGGRLVQDVTELPRLPDHINYLYIDFETTSRDPDKDSLDPWTTCWTLGVAVTWDDAPGSWYVPVEHADRMCNLPKDSVKAWLRDLLGRCRMWVNHNVKYDATVLWRDLGIDVLALDIPLVCTVVQAKIIDSDRAYRGGYGLDALSATWLKEDIRPYEVALKRYLGTGNKKIKDYGRVATDVMAEYACQDVLTNRRLHRYETAMMPEESRGVSATETRLTSVLLDMEREGLLVRPLELKKAKFKCLHEILGIEEELQQKIGRRINPSSNPDCYDVLCNQYGLPVLHWTENDDGTTGGPSFNKKALRQYESRIDAPADVVSLILRHRELSQLKSLFIETFEECGVSIDDEYSVLHPNHNQAVRTGRMSCSKPNTMQQNKRSKELIVPGRGMSFMSTDASQIEFRTIAHYTQDPDVIAAYIANPDIDYHQYVADVAGIKRRPGKTLNFSVAFGQGRRTTVEALSTDKDVVSSILEQIDDMIACNELAEAGREAAFKTLARQRGEAIYDTYHEKFPYIKPTARQAASVCRERGYIRNAMGRRRYLPEEHSNKAFNTLNQSLAADIIKDRMVQLYDMCRGTPVKILTQVHDALLLRGPTEVLEDRRTQRDIVALLEDVHVLRVPIRFKFGVSSLNWADADSDERSQSIPMEELREARRLEHLK